MSGDPEAAQGHQGTSDLHCNFHRQSTASSLSCNAYIVRRLGMRSYDLRSLDKRQRARFFLSRVFWRPFTAPSLALFWRYWNPVYGYYLSKYIYRPCRIILPHSLCVIVTFAFCGFFLHDIFGYLVNGHLTPPHSITTWFTIIALGIVLSEKLDLRFDRLAPAFRVALHVGYLMATYLFMRVIV